MVAILLSGLPASFCEGECNAWDRTVLQPSLASANGTEITPSDVSQPILLLWAPAAARLLCSTAQAASTTVPRVSSAVFVPHSAHLTCDIPPLWRTTSFFLLEFQCVEFRLALQYLRVIWNLSRALCAGITANVIKMPSILSPKLLQQTLTKTVPRLLPGRPYLICPSSLTAKTFKIQAFISKIITDYCTKAKTLVAVTVVSKTNHLPATDKGWEPAKKPFQSQIKILCNIREKQPKLTAPVADSPLHNCCSTAPAEEYQHDYFCVPTQSWTTVRFSLGEKKRCFAKITIV